MQNTRLQNLKLAEKGAWISIGAYIVLSILQLAIANMVGSASLRANGFNNVTDILGNIALLIGLRMARIPADNDHVYGHWKIESIASLISSFIMALVGFEVLREVITSLLTKEQTRVEPIGAVIGIFSAIVMICVYFYNHRLGKSVNSPALLAASKDNLSDAVTSIGTSVAIIASSFHWPIVDRLAAIVICGFIFKTAFDIFRDSAFSLSDGFDDTLLEQYKLAIEKIDKIKAVKLLRGRTYGANVFLDVVVEMSPDMSVSESHNATEEIEKLLREQFDVYDTDVHVEPCALPEESRLANVSLLLLSMEEKLLTGNGSDLKAKEFIEINEFGEAHPEVTISKSGILHYQARQISARTFIISYETDSAIVSSVWRRYGTWKCIHRQITRIQKSE
ncbi:MAG: cation diffusion facilitator family transporter [Streptococcaceae bacterium]|nr:cation diffusion facilitator family transporter [Streptococcaceae bacterium]